MPNRISKNQRTYPRLDVLHSKLQTLERPDRRQFHFESARKTSKCLFIIPMHRQCLFFISGARFRKQVDALAHRMKKFSLRGIEFSTDALRVPFDLANEGKSSDFKVLQGRAIKQGGQEESEPFAICHL